MAEADLYIEDEFPLPSFDVVFGDLNAQRKRRKINPYAISQRAVTICMQSFVYIPQPSKAALFVAQTKSAINGAAPAAAVEEPPTVTTSTNEPGQATALFWDPAPNSASEPAAASSSSSSSSSSSASSSSSQPAAGSEGGSGGGGGAGGAGGGGGSSKSRKSKGDGTTGYVGEGCSCVPRVSLVRRSLFVHSLSILYSLSHFRFPDLVPVAVPVTVRLRRQALDGGRARALPGGHHALRQGLEARAHSGQDPVTDAAAHARAEGVPQERVAEDRRGQGRGGGD